MTNAYQEFLEAFRRARKKFGALFRPTRQPAGVALC